MPAFSRKNSMSKRFLFLISAVALLAACSKSKESSQSAAPAGPPPAQPVKAIIATTSSLDNHIEATGTILANEEVEIRSETSGRVIKLYFKEGDVVNAGSTLLTIDDRELQAQLTKTNLSIDLATDDEQRKKKLLDVGGISKEEYDASRNYLLKLEADKQLLETQIAKTKVTAPFSGTIGLRYISEGGYVSPATLIASLQQTNMVKVEFSVPEKYASSIKNNATVNFTVEGDDHTFEAKVYAREPKIDPQTRSIKVRAIALNAEQRLIPGAFAKLTINLGTIPEAIEVPSEAIIPAITGQTLYVVRSGTAKVQPIKTGIRTATTTQITEGIVPGDTIITTGLLTVRPGAAVKPIIVENKKD